METLLAKLGKNRDKNYMILSPVDCTGLAGKGKRNAYSFSIILIFY